MPRVFFLLLLILLLLLAGCGTATPTQTPVVIVIVVTATPEGTQAPAATPSPAGPTDAEAVLDALRAAGLPVGEQVVYTAATDTNRLLGQPNGYRAKANFHDTRLPADPQGTFDIIYGGSVEVFPDAAGARARAAYIARLGTTVPGVAEADLLHGPIILRLSARLTPAQVAAYQAALARVPGG